MSDILKAKGNEAFAAKDYAVAAELYGNAITLEPTNPVLYSNKAMALIKLSNWKECVEICDEGLKNSPDKKTKLKLLWRKGISYAELNDFKNARESYEQALQNESNNSSVLKSIDELNSRESQFKRSHSIEEIKSEKKPKKEGRLKNIPIYEVDQLPEEFRDPSTKSSKKPSPVQNQEPIQTQIKAPIQNKSTTNSIAPQSQRITPVYPATPTVYQLLSISKCSAEERPYAYQYFSTVSPELYKSIFASGSIESSVVNFILDSIIFALENGSITFENVISLLDVIASAPRFSLISLFSDKQKLLKIKELLSGVGQEENDRLLNVLQKW